MQSFQDKSIKTKAAKTFTVFVATNWSPTEIGTVGILPSLDFRNFKSLSPVSLDKNKDQNLHTTLNILNGLKI